MGSIFGIFNGDGSPVQRDELERMNSALAYRVESPAALQIRGHCGFGVRRNLTESGSATEAGASPSPGMVSAIDARLDNHDPLCRQLGLDPETSSPAEIIDHAFRHWGAACTDHLLGDFAFALYDEAAGRLFCARDHLGVRPFYYAYSDGRFVFATDPRAILALDPAPREICTEAALDYMLGFMPNEDRYLLEGINRLPAAHHLTVDPARMALHRYWRLQPDPELAQLSPEHAVLQFRRVFNDAVAARLGEDGRTGSFLSGGLDSSAVTASAVRAAGMKGRKSPIKTFSAVFPDVPKADESPWIDAVVGFLNKDHQAITPYRTGDKEAGPLRDITRITEVLGEPILAPNLYFSWDTIAQAATTGVTVILTGHDGDSVVGHGIYQLTDLAAAERWDAVEAEITALLGMFAGYEDADKRLAHSYLIPAVGRQARKLRLLSALRILQHLHKTYGIPRKTVIRAELIPGWLLSARRIFSPRAKTPAMLNDRMAMRWRVFRRRQANSVRREVVPELQHARSIRLGAISATFEAFDKLGAAHGIELRHPFFDKRLVELCISLPGRMKSRNGLTRWVLREAMAGVLPDSVRLRKDKADLSPSFVERLASRKETLAGILRSRSPEFDPMFSAEKLEQRCQRLSSSRSEAVFVETYRAACLKVWSATRVR